MEIYLSDLTYNNGWKFDIQEILEDYTEAIWTKRWQELGDCVVKIPTDALKTVTDYNELIDKFLILKGALDDTGNPTPNDYMIIESVVIDYDLDNNEIITIEGKDLLVLLQRRIIWGQQSFRTEQTIKEAVDTLVTDAIVSPSNSDRAIDDFVIDTYTASDTFEASQRSYTNLFEAIVELCKDTYSPDVRFDNGFKFKLYSGVDRTIEGSNPLVFSKRLDNLEKYQYLRDVSDYKNAWLCGGDGEGADRKTQSKAWTDATGITRRELFIDAKDISSTDDDGDIPEATYNQMLLQRIDEKRLETWIKEATTAELTFDYKYGRDYSIGDKATLIDGLGNIHTIRITEFIRSMNGTGYSEYPNFEILGE